jgi:hypothetical protein
LRGATSRAELAVRLWNENRILLEDASPASRVRAFDWLALRGLAPAGFDPLAPLAERRAALEALAASEAAQTASPAAPGEAPE